ncbi:MAG: hypothetical protein ABMA64_29885 [Myxococcota bacterium]
MIWPSSIGCSPCVPAIRTTMSLPRIEQPCQLVRGGVMGGPVLELRDHDPGQAVDDAHQGSTGVSALQQRATDTAQHRCRSEQATPLTPDQDGRHEHREAAYKLVREARIQALALHQRSSRHSW